MVLEGRPSKEFQGCTVVICANRTQMAMPAQYVLPLHRSASFAPSTANIRP
jgi:hypothetical protein